MTTTQAAEEVVRLLPNTSVAATRETWIHKEDGKPETSARITILPGLNGDDCQIITGRTFRACIHKIRQQLASALVEISKGASS